MVERWFISVCFVVLGFISCTMSLTIEEYDKTSIMFENSEEFQPLSMLQLEEHESTETPPFSVCKFLLESAAESVKKGETWPAIAKHIAKVRESLPEHVRSACDSFLKHNREDIVSLLQVSTTDDALTAALEQVASKAVEQQQASSLSSTPAQSTANSASSQQEMFKKFWQQKGQYCGACLTMTKKIQKWLNMNCTQAVIVDRIMRMCRTMPTNLAKECDSNRVWIAEFVLKQLLKKFPLANHCAYIGLCEKTMVIRALQNPMVNAATQNALIEKLEGTGSMVQENELVFQEAHAAPNTAPEITFDLGSGGVSYQDVDKSVGEDLPKVFMDGTKSAFLETEGSIFDLSNPNDPRVVVNAQDDNKVNVPIMHADLAANGKTQASKTYAFQENHLPIAQTWLKGCAACQFTIGALYEFLSNPRTIRTILPVIKKSCENCNNADEVVKCQDFVENQGVAFYQDVIRQGQPSKWCPRLELCEIQYFYPSPHVLADTYQQVKDKITGVQDF
eukprot:c19348_g2_i1.p1 GENE.c19348_g2_i1~~c19348_g2_i1.p1  ORF type:complete len:517 (+),score=178.59 c19348_g2_i1:34-1551(+)